MISAKGFYTFFIEAPSGLDGDTRDCRRTLVLFNGGRDWDPLAALKAAAQASSEAISPDYVIFLGVEAARHLLRECISPSTISEASSFIYALPPATEMKTAFFDNKGTFQWENHPPPGLSADLVRNVGMTEILLRNGAIFETGDTFHFVKPSGRHARTFIRVGEALSSSHQIDFISIWLTEFLLKRRDIQNIYCDTGSIISIVYRSWIIAGTLDGTFPATVPEIESFGSYHRLDDFQFQNSNNNAAIISASTSSGLYNRLCGLNQVASYDIATLYACGLPLGGRVLCDLNCDGAKNPLGLPTIRNWSDDRDCEECKKGSVALRIQGDSFVPEFPSTLSQLITAQHATRELRDFFKPIVGKNILCALKKRNEKDFDNAYINLPKYLKIRAFEFAAFLDKRLPARTTTIVHTGEAEDIVFSTQIAEKFHESTGRMPIILKANELRSRKDIEGHIVVAAGIVRTGRRVRGISRDLRNLSATTSSYLVGISRTRSKEAEAALVRDLAFCNRGGGEKPVSIFQSVRLPASLDKIPSVFEAEIKVLNAILADYPNQLQVTERRTLLRTVLTSSGQELTKCFWKGPKGQALILRNDFALLSNCATPTEDDLYCYITAILHQLRMVDDSPLRRGLQQRVLLSPKNFDRYNDGIIQAALLRAAHPLEMDYTVSPPNSVPMAEIIKSMFDDLESDHAEALPEFILALCSGRMKLGERDLSNLKEAGKSKMFPDAGFKVLWDYFVGSK